MARAGGDSQTPSSGTGARGHQAEGSKLPPSSLPDVIETIAAAEHVDPPVVERVVKSFQRVSARYHRGPLPPVEDFDAYNDVHPGAAGEILNMAVRAQTHGHRMDEIALRSEIKYRILSITLAALVVLSMIAGATICGIYGQEQAAIALGAAAGLSALAGVFVRGRNLFGGGESTDTGREPPRPAGGTEPNQSPPVTRTKRRRKQIASYDRLADE